MSVETRAGGPPPYTIAQCAAWACLWEALTGERLFAKEDAPATLASVLRDEPDFAVLMMKARAGHAEAKDVFEAAGGDRLLVL